MSETQTTTQEQAAQEQPKPVAGVATSWDFKYHFKTDTIRDEEGKEIGKGRKHPDVKAVFPVPTDAQLVESIASNDAVRAYVRTLVFDAIDAAGRAQINEWREANGLDKDFPVTAFDLSKLTLEAIATAPTDKSSGISEDDWKEFYEQYTVVMTQVVKYAEAKVKLHVGHFKTKLARVKHEKEAIAKLLELLNMFAANAPEEVMQDSLACWTDLTQRANKYLRTEYKPRASMF